jgi:hypothetical protein
MSASTDSLVPTFNNDFTGPIRFAWRRPLLDCVPLRTQDAFGTINRPLDDDRSGH